MTTNLLDRARLIGKTPVDYKTTDFCSRCGCSPDAGQHGPFNDSHEYVPPWWCVQHEIAASRELVPALVTECERITGLLAVAKDLEVKRVSLIDRIADRVAEVRHERDAASSRAKSVLQLLRNLLAVIHRDGGHYTEEHGDEKATRDAMEIVPTLRMRAEDAERELSKAAKRIVELEAERDEARALLPCSSCGASDWQVHHCIDCSTRRAKDVCYREREETQRDTAERIAAYVDGLAWNDDGFDENDGDISEQTAAIIAADIRAGSWRKEPR